MYMHQFGTWTNRFARALCVLSGMFLVVFSVTSLVWLTVLYYGRSMDVATAITTACVVIVGIGIGLDRFHWHQRTADTYYNEAVAEAERVLTRARKP